MLIGLTETDSPVTVPTLGLILRPVAPLTFHASVLDAPLEIDAGLALKLLIVGAALAAFTVTVVCAVAEPPVFVAVSV